MAKPQNKRCRLLRCAEPLLLAACWLPLHAFAVDPPTPAVAAGDPAAGDVLLYLEVVLNNQPSGRLLPFVQRDGRLLARPDTLAELDFRLPDPSADELVDLQALEGVTVRYDAALQRVGITAPLSLLDLDATVVDLARQEHLSATSSPGLLFNYDLYASHGNRYSNATAYGELRASGGGAGVFSTSAVTRAYRNDNHAWRGDSVRLDSSWQLSFPDRMTRLVVGDTQTGNLAWTRGVRLGGIRFGRDFSLQPYRVTTPLPTFLGEVAVPSEVELYVNGIRQYNGELPVGPFQLATQPNINGLGNAQLVITDAFGSVRTIDFPFYASQQLLADGLSDWSVTAGLVREDYGLRSFSYDSTPVASADARHGLTDELTLEAHVEGGDGLANGGIGAVWSLGRFGVANASYAHSDWRDASGHLTSLGYRWTNTRFSISFDSTRTHGEYRDIASGFGQDRARASERALAGWNSASLGNFGTSWLRLEYPGEDASRYASAYWNRSFGRRWAVNLSVNQNLDASDDRSAYLSISVNLGDRRSLHGSFQRNGDRNSINTDLNQTVSSAGGLSWRVRASHDDGGHVGGLAEAGWLGEHGRINGGVASSHGTRYGYAGASGGLVVMGGHVFAARNVHDAFAVVSTDGIADVPVKLENRLIGTTDGDGMLLVSPLNAWQRNRLAIDPMDLPVDVRLGEVERIAVPTDRAGTLVEFDVTPVRAAVVVLHDVAGEPLAAGSTVLVAGTPAISFVGYGGEAYLDTLATRNTLRVTTTEGTCEVTFDYPADAGPVPRVGPLECVVETTR